ncbi:MAG: hypothetical protein CSA97_04750 [Bacteroidetes bacterium]|nr:MAG: hypothetical protein CSA97_04750 [Bacteroidota bacterium]
MPSCVSPVGVSLNLRSDMRLLAKYTGFLLVLILSTGPWAWARVSLEYTLRGENAPVVHEGGSLEKALGGVSLTKVERLAIVGGEFKVEDWSWLREQRLQLSGLKYFEIKESTRKVSDIPGLDAYASQRTKWGYKSAGLDTARTFFGDALEVLLVHGVKAIGQLAFNHARALKLAQFPDLESIGDGAFEGCEKLAVLRAKKVVSIGEKAFKDCYALRLAEYQRVEHLGEYAFQNARALGRVDFQLVDELDEGVFAGCTRLEVAKFASVEWVGLWAFQHCTSLSVVSFPMAHLIVVGAFQGCSSLKQAVFPMVESIGNWAFLDCTSLERVALPSLKRWGLTAFRNCMNLRELALPVAVPTIQIPESVGTISEQHLTRMLCMSCPASRKLTTYRGDRFVGYAPTNSKGDVLYAKDKGYTKGRWYGWGLPKKLKKKEKS